MSFDAITLFIIFMGIFNVIVYVTAIVLIRRLDKIVHPKSDRRVGMQANMAITDDDCAELSKSSGSAAFVYTLFTNITAIFPLLGIFGTVMSLLQSSKADDLPANFLMALTTTAAGLIAAMIFKFFDSFISSTLDRALDEADYLIHEHDEEKRQKYAAQAETRHNY